MKTWKIWESKKSEYIIRNDDSIGELVMTVTPGSEYRRNDLEKFKQDVNLIVAAPEMFEALKLVLDASYDKIDPSSPAMVAVRTAIAKTGHQ